MKILAAVAGALAVAGAATACSSYNSSSAAHTKTTGTEVLHGQITGAQALRNPTFHLHGTGIVSTTATIPLGGSPKKGAVHAFHTPSGDLAVRLDSSGKNTGGLKSTKTCEFAFGTTIPITVQGSKSTGKFAGASGKGHALVVFSGKLKKLSNGKCDLSRNARPVPSTAVGTFTAKINLTVHH